MLPALSDIIEHFESVDGTEKLELLLDFGERLPVLPDPYRELRDAGLHMIHECQSPVFLLLEVVDGNIRIHADVPREAPIARGFVALLNETFDGIAVDLLRDLPTDLLQSLGLSELLSFQRRRGLSAIYQQFLAASRFSAVPETGPLKPNPHVTAIVLAAGASVRMGSQNKLLLDFRGKPLVAHIVDTIVEAGLHEIVVVVGHDADRVRQSLASYPVLFAENRQHAEGMSTSIHAGVNAAASSSAGFMICLADLPLIESEEFVVLGRAFAEAIVLDPNAIVLPVHGGRRGNPVLFSARYRQQMLAQRGPTGCRAVVTENPDHVVEVEMNTDHVLVDIDTRDAYQRLTD